MLPKPNFNSSPANSVLSGNNGPPSGQNRVQYQPNLSLNHYATHVPTIATNLYANPYGNGYNSFANNYPPMQPNLWPQHNSNSGNLWSGNYNQPNRAFNPNYNRFNGQQYHRNVYQPNQSFKNKETMLPNANANQFNKNKTLNCDTCCRWFQTQEQYDQHMSEHVMCGLDECTFRAHPKVIESHQRMQHFCFRDKTLVKKFMTLETEEDINKWREERKRNFPTKDNIKQKQELKESQKEMNKSFDKNKRFKRKFDITEDNIESNGDKVTKESNNEEEVEVRQESESFANKRNKKKKWKNGGKGSDRTMASREHQNNRKLTLFQKLMAMDEQKNAEKK